MNGRAHILIVDDDVQLRARLRSYLESNGFRATAVADGRETRKALQRSLVELVVLDLMLPNESGLEICRELRAKSNVPVIMLSAMADEMDRVIGLEVGADDYMPKPFSPRELLSRIRAVLRRAEAARDDGSLARADAVRFGKWRIDLVSRMLSGPSAERVALGGADYRLLTILLAHAPSVVSRARLFELLRGREFDPLDRSIDVRVSRLRQVLGDDARAPEIIKTVYGEGYAISVPVERESGSRPTAW